MNYQIFIDGEEGTTGLQIKSRIRSRSELSLIQLSDKDRKSSSARKEALLASDIAILCLPDDAAMEAITLLKGNAVRLIDASTAHRTSADWVYGFPELDSVQSQVISNSSLVSNPGCYSTGAIALLRPLVSNGIISNDHPITINAISGYSGGGKSLISRMEDDKTDGAIISQFFGYGFGLEHKHVPEIMAHSGLKIRPLFVPSVGRFHQGMIVQIPLYLSHLPLKPSVDEISKVLTNYYSDKKFVSVANDSEKNQRLDLLDPEELNGTNHMRLFVFGSKRSDHAVLCAQLDNLGKGASGQAVQNLNLMLKLPEDTGL